MGKRHNTLDYKYFHKTNYIKSLENLFCITDFKQEYKQQFEIMYDIFKTLILLNNIIFADSNKSIDDKITDLEVELEKCLYGDLDNDSNKYKYSVRQINDLLDKHSRYLFKKFIDWYEYLISIGKLNQVKIEIDEEMKKLEQINFDYIINDNIIYKKNKDSKQSIYLSKFFKYNLNKDFLNEYLDNYYKLYLETTDKSNLAKEICLIYNLVAYANNGIIKKVYSSSKTNINEIEFNFEFTENLNDFFETYFKKYLHLKFNDIDIKKINEDFIDDTSKVLMYFMFSFSDEANFGTITELEICQNYDYYIFIMYINQIIEKEIIFNNHNAMLMKIVENLKNVFNLIKLKKYDEALNIIDEIIKQNKEIYIRVS